MNDWILPCFQCPAFGADIFVPRGHLPWGPLWPCKGDTDYGNVCWWCTAIWTIFLSGVFSEVGMSRISGESTLAEKKRAAKVSNQRTLSSLLWSKVGLSRHAIKSSLLTCFSCDGYHIHDLTLLCPPLSDILLRVNSTVSCGMTISHKHMRHTTCLNGKRNLRKAWWTKIQSCLEVIENILQKHLFQSPYPPTAKGGTQHLFTHFPKDPLC